MLVYEATRDAADRAGAGATPVGADRGLPAGQPAAAGAGAAGRARHGRRRRIALIPEAHVGFVGMARDEETHQPAPYLESLPTTWPASR